MQIPIIFMMYYNTVLHYGVKEFVKKCNEAGVDGLIIPDLPLEEQDEINEYLNLSDATILIQLVSPVSGKRIRKSLRMREDLCTVYLPWVSPGSRLHSIGKSFPI